MLLENPGGHAYRFVSEICCQFSLHFASTRSPAYYLIGTYVMVVPLLIVAQLSAALPNKNASSSHSSNLTIDRKVRE